MRRVWILVVWLCFGLLLMPGQGLAAAGDTSRVGKRGIWERVVAAAMHGDNLFTIEKNGTLNKVNLKSGDWDPVGKRIFKRTGVLIGGEKGLLLLESTFGTLFAVNHQKGTKKQVGKTGAWISTLASCVHGGKLYSAEGNGVLYVADLTTGKSKALGDRVFRATRFLLSTGKALYSIERDGSLYRIDPKSGGVVRVGKKGDWKDTMVATTTGGRLYTIEKSGALYSINPKDGTWRQLGKRVFKKTRFLAATQDVLYRIDKEGTLFRIALEAR